MDDPKFIVLNSGTGIGLKYEVEKVERIENGVDKILIANIKSASFVTVIENIDDVCSIIKDNPLNFVKPKYIQGDLFIDNKE